jgi:steroid delta-isomerase-like uncharacterized protein
MRLPSVLVAVLAVALVGLAAARPAPGAVAPDATPAPSEAEALARAFYEPFRTGDTSVYDRVLAEDWANYPLDPGQQPGRAGIAPVVARFRADFADLSVTIEDVIVAGDKVTVRSTLRSTHRGDLLGLPPTGRAVEFMAIDIHRIEGGRIAETWHVEDYLGLLRQLGATIRPGPGAASPAAATPAP